MTKNTFVAEVTFKQMLNNKAPSTALVEHHE